MGFLAATAKNERIATLQPADIFTLSCLLNHQPVDVLLLKVFLACFFADADDFGCGLYFFKQALVDQAVVKHNIGFAQACEAAHGNQVWISRSSADNEYGPEVLHNSITSFLQFVLARAEETSHKNCDGFLGVFEDSWSNSPPHEKG